MNINIDVQSLCVPQNKVRGIPCYMKNLISAFLKHSKNDYTFSFFDYGKERGNRKYFYTNMGFEIRETSIFENNNVDYRLMTKAIGDKDVSFFGGTKYADYFPYTKWDLLHLPCHLRIPPNLNENTVVTVHDILPIFNEKTLTYEVDANQIFNNSMEFLRDNNIRVIAISEYTKEKLIEYYNVDEKKIEVVYNGFDNESFYNETNKEMLETYNLSGRYLLYLGAIQRRKDMYSVLKAYEIVKEKKQNNDLKMVFAGDKCKQTDDFYKLVRDSKYSEDIVLTGYVTDEERRWLMSSAEVFVFPSLAEGFGLPIIEAMACETPVITTNQTSMPEVGGDAALYVPPRRPDLIADYIISLLENESLRLGCIKKGIKQKEKFSWERCSRETEDIYKKMK